MRVLIVDDSKVYCQVLVDIISAIPSVTAYEVAMSGREALEKARAWRPDLITLDLDLPDLSGLRVLRELKAEGNPAAVVVLSGLTEAGTSVALLASELGAMEVLVKPRSIGQNMPVQELTANLHGIIGVVESGRAPARVCASRTTMRKAAVGIPARRPAVFAIGASTGGPAVIASLVERFPAGMKPSVLVALHLAEGFTHAFAAALSARASVPVVEAVDGQPVLPGTVYVAPGGRQMEVLSDASGQVRIRVSDDPAENGCRPSIDRLFRSVADVFGSKAVAVILTGMGKDGSSGLRRLKDRGAFVMAQDEASSVVYGMPSAAVEAGVVDVVAAPVDLAAKLVALAERPE